ncbi:MULTISPECIES: ABC transporter permease [Streptomyces]|uniref:ABC transporter permease n=1 Tax=Streptomyces tsukubensis (strain DSM 42081 / NBRC 108919 / NRRL 18488 / 9993) TaxID=1114943 RepID=I2N8L0_STRT9|nr:MULTISPECIES: ABC transporter permease [Streptomyces]AZK97232.1 sulfate ABC transporter permease [Streptomyces tsukubensis]EIF93357.1 ABC transporter permease [Streptomyces tsukubensis NRRL18488]MYS65790.1 ABC transporter permease subunit [Streptomyces sp. SID5473]QKM66802.1 ABC transporter permease [Streptomyces tsukubensis NRRL18488]TAI44851.1 ABC transporter permease [Streptomyces tsukubensis]
MVRTETPSPAKQRAGGDGGTHDLAAGLDALETVETGRASLREVLLTKVVPPLTAVALVIAVWQTLVWAEVTDEGSLPAPSAVWDSVSDLWLQGTLLEIVWTSVSRGFSGFLLALAIGTPLGLLVARVKFVRAAIGPILSGLQSLPSVAWVPPAVIWLGLNNQMMYAVILLGAVPSIANGLVSGVDQVPPLFLRAGRTLGATGLKGTWYIVMPAALPGYVAGLKQGWAFAWRSLMAAEIIASSPDLGLGLGQLLENGRNNSDMPGVFLAILLILVVGIAIDLLVFSPLERAVLRGRGLLVKN